ncbi:hypothetical protein WA026_002324 [Henosepilachna vigintioctopunctata]|uniref:Angiotensin-converting enzyme n=1 Tax=Henosepilachna vigintioctopunctata TaxID=420089 RepID=A0AAW1TZ45_9CUCU
MVLSRSGKRSAIQCLVQSLCVFLNFDILNIFGVQAEPNLQGINTNLGDALQFLREFDSEASRLCFTVGTSQWTYATNMTDFNKRRMVEEQTIKAKFERITWNKASSFDWSRITDPMARRHLKLLLIGKRGGLPDEKYNEIYHLISEMKDIYSNVRVCPFDDNYTNNRIYCDIDLEGVSKIMEKSRNPLELAYIWKEWHDKAGPPMKNKFMRYIELANQAAKINGFQDAGEEMRYAYEDRNFEDEISESFQRLQPLYKELFTYVRKKLFKRYGPSVVRLEGPLPAHILGNIWAQEWSHIEEIVTPYPDIKTIDVTHEMRRQGFTPLRMFQMSEEFFTSLGLKPMPPEFWKDSMIEKPVNRKVQCSASAWDFCNRIDYRIKQCTEVGMQDLISTHHEMAHIQYYLYYAKQPYLYRNGANEGFHEGVSNAISLSVYNPTHLHLVGLFNNDTIDYETNIKFLFGMALKKVAYASFAYLVDLWRYEIFRNGVSNMNSDWWELRTKFQGIVPPITRNEQHLDPATKRHIAADIPYMKYYVALLLEFQIFDALCTAAGHTGSLHNCDIYRSREAGRLLSDALSLGKSKHWKEVLRLLTRGKTDKISADAMIKYFQPLYIWLKVQNKNEKIVGWITKQEDAALFQPLVSSNSNQNLTADNYIINIIIVYSLLPIFRK